MGRWRLYYSIVVRCVILPRMTEPSSRLLWRVCADLTGRVVSEGWVREDGRPWRPTRQPVGPRPEWMDAPGAELLPRCLHCDSPQVWRGTWRCEACNAKGLSAAHDARSLPRTLPSEALAGVDLWGAATVPSSRSLTHPSWQRTKTRPGSEAACASSPEQRELESTAHVKGEPLKESQSGRTGAPTKEVSRDDNGAGFSDSKELQHVRGSERDNTQGSDYGAISTRASDASSATPIFSSQIGNNSTKAPTPTIGHWRSEVEALTSFHRQATAGRLLLRGTRRCNGFVTDVHTGEVKSGEPYVSAWYQSRIRGQAERFQNVAECGGFQYALETEHGVIPLRKRCDCWRVCTRCTRSRRRKLSDGMQTQRALALRLHKRESQRVYRGKEGKWSEKLITFTVPHSESPAADARCIVDAWQKLLRKIRAHLLLRGAVRRSKSGKRVAISVPWCRALEVAPGQAGGHAHMHVWWYGPFLDSALLRQWWGELISATGRTVPRKPWSEVRQTGRDRRLASWLGNPRDHDEIWWPVVDITAARSDAASEYTQKVGVALYTVKGGELTRLSAAHAAKIYEVFEGTRAVQWARGWAPKKGAKYRQARLRRLTQAELEALWSRLASSMEQRQKDTQTALRSEAPLHRAVAKSLAPS